MTTGEVYINVPAVRGMAKSFGTIHDVLNTVSKVMEALSTTLKATAFIGLVGGYAIAHFIDQIKPHIDDMAKKCQELNTDLSSSVDAYERGDTQGATRFY